MGIEEYTATYNGTYTTSCVYASFVNKCDSLHAVSRNWWSFMDISTSVEWTYNVKETIFYTDTW